VSRKRLWLIGGLVLAAIVISSVAWAMQDDLAYANTATGYVAKTTCSCRHVSGRDWQSCISDLPADARSAINVTEDANTVRATVLFGAISSESMYEEGFGCRIVD
jgi:hypothetical protein